MKLVTLSVCLLSSALLAGCAGHQVIDSISGDGLYTKAAVPSGGGTSIGIVAFIGRLNHTTIVQDSVVNTNTGTVNTPNVVVAVAGAGKQNVNAGAGVSTNSTATVADGSRDMAVIVTGNGYANGNGSGTNSSITISGNK